jgi:hypothetical protein
LNSGVQEVDPLGNLQITPGRVIEGLEIRICLGWSGRIIKSVSRANKGKRHTYPEHLLKKVLMRNEKRKSVSGPN